MGITVVFDSVLSSLYHEGPSFTLLRKLKKLTQWPLIDPKRLIIILHRSFHLNFVKRTQRPSYFVNLAN